MSKGLAKLAISQGLSVWVLEAPQGFGDAAYHSHHAIQITVCLSGALALSSEEVALEGKMLAVAADMLLLKTRALLRLGRKGCDDRQHNGS